MNATIFQPYLKLKALRDQKTKGMDEEAKQLSDEALLLRKEIDDKSLM